VSHGTGRPLRVHALIDSLIAGGAEMLLTDFAVAARAADLEISVGCLSDRDGSRAAARLRAQGIEPAYVRGGSLLDPATVWRVRQHLAARRPALVHTHLAYADALGGVAARTLGIPVVSTVHVMEWPKAGRDRLRERLVAACRRRCASRVITVSEAARREFLAGGWDHPRRVVTVHNGIAATPCSDVGRRIRAELGMGSGDLVIGMIGVLRGGKGHELAAGAVSSLLDRFPHVRLLVVGDGPLRAHVQRLLEPLGHAALSLGHRDDVMAVLDAVDVLVHPSSVDAFPTVLLEAMAAGVPVVASAVGGVPEIVVHDRTGLLLEAPVNTERLADELARLVADGELRRRLGSGGRARFEERFTAETWARRMRVLYQSVLSEAPGGFQAAS
jgi:glycosyltransferase involved in cell wall biosynthesis